MKIYTEDGWYIFGDQVEGIIEASMSGELSNSSTYVEKLKKQLAYSTSTNIETAGPINFMYVKSDGLMRIRYGSNNIYCKRAMLVDVYHDSVNIKNIGRVTETGKVTSIATTVKTVKDALKNFKYSRLIAGEYDSDNPPSVIDTVLYLTYGHDSVYVSTNVPADATGQEITDAINIGISSTIFSSHVEMQWKTDHVELVSLRVGSKVLNVMGNLANAIGFSDPTYKSGNVSYANSAKYHLRWISGARRDLTSIITTVNHHDISIANTIGVVGDYYAIVNNSQSNIEVMLGYI